MPLLLIVEGAIAALNTDKLLCFAFAADLMLCLISPILFEISVIFAFPSGVLQEAQ